MGYWEDEAKKEAKKRAKGKNKGLFTWQSPAHQQPGYSGKVNGMGPRGGVGGVTGSARIKPMSKAEERRLIKEARRREKNL